MRDSGIVADVVALLIGGVAVAAMMKYMMLQPRLATFGAAVGVIAFTVLVSTIAVIASSLRAGIALCVSGCVVLINDLLLAAKFATILGVSHLALANSVGALTSSALLVIVIAAMWQAALLGRQRVWVLLLIAVLLILTAPSKVSSQFFI